jgi:hypothetical protein
MPKNKKSSYIVALIFVPILIWLVVLHKQNTSCSHVLDKSNLLAFEGIVKKKGWYSFDKGRYVEAISLDGQTERFAFHHIKNTTKSLWYEAEVGDRIIKASGNENYYLVKKDTTIIFLRYKKYGCSPD